MNYSSHNNPAKAKATNAQSYPLGESQATALRELASVTQIYAPMTARGTTRQAKILDSLVRKGMAVEPAHGHYVITKAGKAWVNQNADPLSQKTKLEDVNQNAPA